MAKNNDNILLNGITGHLGKQIVLKQDAYGTVISKYPNMANMNPSEKQLKEKSNGKKKLQTVLQCIIPLLNGIGIIILQYS